MKLFKWFKKYSSRPSYHKISITGKRDVNQDECIVLELGHESIFMAVADGMGGATNGYIASNIAINLACDILENNFKNEKNIKTEELKNLLKSIYVKIQEVIKEQIARNPVLDGMGTTLTSILIHKGKYVWGNIGDSRIYKYKNKELIKLTEDHSYINDFEKERSSAASSEIKVTYGHLLTRCLDGGEDQPDIFPLNKDYEELENKDLFLLCSDGLILHDSFAKNKFYSKLFKPIFRSNNFQKVARNLINKSIKEGSTDNISLILYLNR